MLMSIAGRPDLRFAYSAQAPAATRSASVITFRSREPRPLTPSLAVCRSSRPLPTRGPTSSAGSRFAGVIERPLCHRPASPRDAPHDGPATAARRPGSDRDERDEEYDDGRDGEPE